MKREKIGLIILCFFIMGSLIFPFEVNAQTKPGSSGFPPTADLAKKNVRLEMEGFEFASGLRPDEKGDPNCNGLELLKSGGAGSGFIVKDDGTVVTNYHVARKSLKGKAVFQDGSSYEIKNIKVYDPIKDIAILKISAQKTFPVCALGDSEKTEPLDEVLAVGNPLDMGINVTQGRISQVVRDDNNKVTTIRHTAAIAPGNSGGALYKGDKVVGVNVAVRLIPQLGGAPSPFYEAIPINKVKELLQNPQYNRLIPLEGAFPPVSERILQKCEQLHAQNGQVSAGSGNDPGAWVLNFNVYGLQDLLISVSSPGRDLAIMVLDQAGNIIGLGDLKVPDVEGLFLSSNYPQTIKIAVLNYESKPANFGLAVFKIAW